MARRTKMYRQFSWPAFFSHLVLIAGVAVVIVNCWPAIKFSMALLIGFALYFIYSSASRAMLLPRHGQAMKLFREGNYPAAIAAFEASDAYLAAHPWIDQQRWIVLLNASAISYREIALFNIGKAHTFLGHAGAARKAFTRFLEEAPRSTLAPTVRVILGTLDKKKK